MDTQITARHFEASPTLRQYAAERLGKLERFYDGITDAHIILATNNGAAQNKEAEITLNVYRQRLCAQDNASTHEEAVDRCVESLRRQVLKYKDKLKSKSKDAYR